MPAARLVLEDSTVYEGEAFGSTENAIGEVVFNTSLTGYQEIATDPSYRFQIVVMTYPHIGNYGVGDRNFHFRSTTPSRRFERVLRSSPSALRSACSEEWVSTTSLQMTIAGF